MGKNEDALNCYNEEIKLHPEDPYVYIRRGNLFFLVFWGKSLANEGKNEDALKCYDEAIKIEPKNSYVLRKKCNFFIEIFKVIFYLDWIIMKMPSIVMVKWSN